MSDPEASNFFNKDLDQFVQDALSFYHVPGMSIGIIHKGKTYAKGYGYSNLESQTAVKPNTLFCTASTSKSFAAATFALLVSDSSKYKNVDYTTPISSIIRDDFVLADDWATKHITFEDALCHRTGYPRYDLSYGGPGTDLRTAVRSYRNLCPTKEPRMEWCYQNMAYMVVSLAIEKLTGSSLGEFMRTHIWEPLGLKSTFITLEDATEYVKSSNEVGVSLATPYTWICADRANVTPLATRSDGDHFAPISHINYSYFAGAGGIISSVLDYTRYLDCLLHQAPPFPAAVHAQLRKQRIYVSEGDTKTQSDQNPPFTGPTGYSTGWFYNIYTRGSQPVEIWNHAGGWLGYGTEMCYIPVLELGIVSMGNIGGGGNQAGNEVVYEIIDNMLGVPRSERFDWRKEALKREAVAAKDLIEKRHSLFGNLGVGGDSETVLLPMTVKWDSHEGLFRHPAYQDITISLQHRRTSSEDDAQAAAPAADEDSTGHPSFQPAPPPAPSPPKPKPNPYLLIIPSPRTLNWMMELSHVSGEWFLAEQFDYLTPESTLPDTISEVGRRRVTGRSRALFKLAPDGEAQSVGLELEPALVEWAQQRAKAAVGGGGDGSTGKNRGDDKEREEGGGGEGQGRGQEQGEEEEEEEEEKGRNNKSDASTASNIDWSAVEKGMIWFERVR